MALLDKRMQGLASDLSSSIAKLADGKVTPKNVHQLRTTIRRIESLITYANPELGKKVERSVRKMADLRKRAGKVRDLDVQVELLAVLGNGSTARDKKILAELLEKKRQRQAERLVTAVKKVQDSKFFTRIQRIAGEFDQTKAEKVRPQAPLEEAKSQLGEMAKDFSEHQVIKVGRLHEARISLKKIRYLAEAAEESEAQKDFTRQLKIVQDAIGDWHDWQELTATAEKRFSDRVNCALLREVRALLAARHSTATSSMNNLFVAATESRKPPHAAQPLRAFARHA
jgi:CHAD domain-containing protein